mgnify:CR=1 FL=1|tara:strand:+ start:621 stop:1037 length:417 start_codon:yes stop_codon:yes gene_type:complete
MNKERIDDLVDIWLDTVSRTEVGWPKNSMISKFMLYRGSFQDTTQISGLEKFVDRQARTHARFADIQVALEELDEDKAMAIIAKRYFRGLNEKNKTYTNKDRATEIGMRLREYEHACSAAYKQIEKTLTLLEKRQKLI